MTTRSKAVIPTPGGSTVLLKIMMLAILVLPSYMVLGTLGASGNLPHLLALAALVFWLLASTFGLHNPTHFGHPGRAALVFWILASCWSYVAMFAGFSGGTGAAERAAADRWLLLIFAGAGITLLTTESIRTIGDIKAVTRWVMGGAAFCCVVAIIQFQFKINPMEWINSMMVGFHNNGSGTAYQSRDSFMRVSGTTLHPIELSVVCSMLLPLSLWWALFDREIRKRWRAVVPVLLFVGNIVTVSRTGLLGLGLSAVILLPYLPKTARRWALVVVPAGVASLFVLVPGIVSTLFSSATAGSSDSSITYRTDDYPLAWRLFFQHPLFGLGPGSWMPVDMKNIFDNQYLLTVVTMGGVGLAALLIYVLVPFFAALTTAHHAQTTEMRVLAAAIAAAMLVAAVSAGTFDAMSFQTCAFMFPFFIGLGGVAWINVKSMKMIQSEGPSLALRLGNAKE